MKDRFIDARNYQTGQPIRIRLGASIIDAIEPLTADPPAVGTLPWIAPGLFDIQVNGYTGVDFQQDDLSMASLLAAVRGLRADGCTRFFFTLITAEWNVLMARLERARKLCAESDELRSAIAGWHIEGPFLSDLPGFCGAHDTSVMLDPCEHHMRELRNVAGSDPVLCTIAPERHGALEAIRLGKSLGFTISLGHTDASQVLLRAAVNAGATGFTHLANGCPREMNRHDNIIWRVGDMNGLTVSLIPDGIHVSPAPFRLLHRLLGKNIYYTTDAMAAAGAPPGQYRLGGITVEVGLDQIVRQPGRTNFAGSALRPIEAVFRAAGMLGCSWQECWWRLAEAPAHLVGMKHSLRVGVAIKNCCLITFDAKENPSCRSIE